MKRTIVANARYWLDTVNAASENAPLPESDVRGAARALEAVITVPEAWDLTLSLALALHPHAERHGYWADWDDFLQMLISRTQQRADRLTEIQLWLKKGEVQQGRGDYQAAVTSYRRTWRLCRQIGDERDRARAFSDLGFLYWRMGQLDRAEILCKKALVVFEILDDTVRLARTENHLGLICYSQERLEEARLHLTRSKALSEQVNDRHGLAKALQNLGLLHRHIGELETALDYFEQASHHYHTSEDEIRAAQNQLNIGNVYRNRSDLLRAEKAYTQAEAVLSRVGDSLNLARARHNLGMVYAKLEDWDEAQVCFEQALAQWRNLEDVWNLANTLGELAGLHIARDHPDRARVCLSEAQELVEEKQGAPYAALRRELAELWERLRRLTGDKALE